MSPIRIRTGFLLFGPALHRGRAPGVGPGAAGGRGPAPPAAAHVRRPRPDVGGDAEARAAGDGRAPPGARPALRRGREAAHLPEGAAGEPVGFLPLA